MKMMICWASRDFDVDYVKVWRDEPRLFKNTKWVGKTYHAGCFYMNEWPGPSLEKGEKKKVVMHYEEVID